LNPFGPRQVARTIVADLADAQVTRQAGRDAMPVDFLVNCAGTTTLQSFLGITVEAFDHLIAVNTRAPMILAQEYARQRIAEGKGGAIVNVSSNSAFNGFADHAAYCARRAGSMR
jgi:L-xylulose reductase